MSRGRKKRIAIDARWVFPEVSGIGRYTLELLRRLAAREADVEWRIWVCNAERRDFVRRAANLDGRSNVVFAELPYGPFSPLGQWAAARLLRKHRIDIYHSTNFMVPLPAFSRRRPHIPACVCNIHDLIPLVHPEFTPQALKTRFFPVYKALMHEIARRVDAVITGSLAAKEDIIRLLPIPAERITTVYDGVDERYVPGGPKPSTLGGPQTLLYVGRSDPYKNLPFLVEAFARLVKADGLNVRLKIIGPPDARYPEAAETARRLEVVDRVDWTGYVDEPALLKAYQDADALALLSRYEGFGLPVAEAMACGTPVVCSNVTSLPEVAGSAALLVPPDDLDATVSALRRVLTDDAEAARLRAVGLEQARRFSWDAAADAVWQTYQEVMP
ncbi:MAG: glycosyltransferase family 4 protein [Verrucomicrobiota bacterium]|jgi:alpha-1,3-rhamnosyl/mannosyltransferase|nr:glycosyltransferase family 4 protein [Verrucomicrobiota bacterium]